MGTNCGNLITNFAYSCLWIIYSVTIVSTIIVYKQIINTAKNTFKTFDILKICFLIILILISIFLLTPIFILSLLIFFVLKLCVAVALKRKYGSKFGGMLGGGEIYFSSEGRSNNVINFLLILNYEGEPHDFYNKIKCHIKKKIFSDTCAFPILKSIRQKHLGYFFTIKNEYDVEDCISILDCGNDKDIIDEATLQVVMNNFGTKQLPKGNNAFWEILVGNKRVQWKNNKHKQYPLIIRIHHSLGDGATLIQWFIYFFMDSKYPNNTIQNDQFQTRTFKHFYRKLLKFFQLSRIFFTSPIVSILHLFVKATDRNVLHGKQTLRKTILVCKTESENKYIQMIKEVKQKLPGTSFMDILLTATAKSFANYMQKTSTNTPDSIYAAIAGTTKLPNLKKFCASPNKHFELNCKNLTSGGIRLPLSSVSVLKTLDLVKQETNILNNSLIFQVNNMFLRLACIVPPFLVEYISSKMDATLIISNLPTQLDSLFICNGLKVDDFVIWTVQRAMIGISLVIMAQEDKLKVALMVDEAFVSNEDDAKRIVNDIFKQLDMLNKEVNVC